MIGDGRLQTQLTAVGNILVILNLFEERQQRPNKSLGGSHFKHMSYRQIYEECIREFAYDFRLIDQSLLLFVKKGKDEHDGLLGFSFLECPVSVMSYQEFVGDQYGLSPLDSEFETVLAQFGDDLRFDYEQYVSSTNVKDAVTPLRYDYKATDYKEGSHPASHVHFGFRNDIRVATQRIMNPVSFTLFVIRQRWPDAWRKFLVLADCEKLCRNVRQEIETVNTLYWRKLDDFELFLN